MLILTKRFEFSASHRLYREDWNEESNHRVYGKCANPNGHGHNYRLEVSVSGPIDRETWMVIDAAKLQSIVDELVIRDVDHKNLNSDVAWLEGRVPTVEAVLDAIWSRLGPAVSQAEPKARLEKLVLHETSRIYATRTHD